MPERSKGAVLKTAARKCRGFESLSLRCPFRCLAHVPLKVARRGGRAAEGNRLLSGLAPIKCYEGSNPSLSAAGMIGMRR